MKGFSGQVFRFSAGTAWRALGRSKQVEEGRSGLQRPAQSLSWGHTHPMASCFCFFKINFVF